MDDKKIVKYEELRDRLKGEISKDLIPEASKKIIEDLFEKPEMKNLFEEHNKLVAQGADPKAQAEQKVPFAQSARFLRALHKNDTAELAKIQAEELPKWEARVGKKTLTYMNETTPAQGGYLVPTEYYAEIMKLECEYGIARRDCRIFPMVRKSMTIPTLLTRPIAYWIGEAELKEESKPTLAQVTLNAVKLICLVVLTDELLADATPPIVQFIIEIVREVIAMNEDDALFNGNGGAGIAGVLSCGTAVVMDNNRQTYSQVHTDDLIKLVAAAACGSRKNGKFYFHYDILTWLRLLKGADGHYILNESPVAGQPPTLWNKPYETSDVMPDNTTVTQNNTPFIVFGDFKKTVAFGDRMTLTTKMADQATIKNLNLFTYDLQALRFVERLDIECLLAAGITVLWTNP